MNCQTCTWWRPPADAGGATATDQRANAHWGQCHLEPVAVRTSREHFCSHFETFIDPERAATVVFDFLTAPATSGAATQLHAPTVPDLMDALEQSVRLAKEAKARRLEQLEGQADELEPDATVYPWPGPVVPVPAELAADALAAGFDVDPRLAEPAQPVLECDLLGCDAPGERRTVGTAAFVACDDHAAMVARTFRPEMPEPPPARKPAATGKGGMTKGRRR